jgi:hypothetical protein
MAVFKRVLCRERLRQVPPQFSWIDHRLVRERHISRCSANALALYLFLVTVADGQGLSYYADATVCRLLPLDGEALGRARRELIDNRLIAYQRPLYQVLALGPPAPARTGPASPASPSAHRRRPTPQRPGEVRPNDPAPSNVQGPQSIAQILRQLAELDSVHPSVPPSTGKP